MAVIVSIFGGLIVVIGLLCCTKPTTLIRLVGRWHSPARFWFAVGIRLGLGVVLLVVAPDCRAPLVVRIVGVIAIAAALGLLVMGRTRLDALVTWWLLRPARVRISGVFAIAFGVLLLYAGA